MTQASYPLPEKLVVDELAEDLRSIARFTKDIDEFDTRDLKVAAQLLIDLFDTASTMRKEIDYLQEKLARSQNHEEYEDPGDRLLRNGP
jgi:hypothetical protein